MKKNPKVLALITARGGSKRLPRKNVKLLGGIPLISWTIREARKSKYITKLILSTDDLEAIEIAKAEECEVPFVRPTELAGDYSTSYDVAAHAIDTVNETYDWLVLLQPTSPFRTVIDIDAAIEMALEKVDVDSVISVCISEKSHLMYFLKNADETLSSPYGIKVSDLNHTRSQDMPMPYEINGAVYVVKIDWFLKNKMFFDEKTVVYEMPIDRSVNIDTEHDWLLAEIYLNRYKLKNR